MTTAQRINLCILEKRIEKLRAKVRELKRQNAELRGKSAKPTVEQIDKMRDEHAKWKA